jgi:hypothetical protein
MFDWLQAWCAGNCAVTGYAGPRLDTSLSHVLGFKESFIPPWQYNFGDSGLVGAAFSRVLLDGGQWADIEAELGVGQRFGSLHEQEVWVALYGRWKYFPWNDHVRTSLAISTGLNYADGIPPYEAQVSVSGTDHGSNLLHYFGPELTLGLPSYPNLDFVVRIHHRSGGQEIWGYAPIFKGVNGGAQELVFGLRDHF